MIAMEVKGESLIF